MQRYSNISRRPPRLSLFRSLPAVSTTTNSTTTTPTITSSTRTCASSSSATAEATISSSPSAPLSGYTPPPPVLPPNFTETRARLYFTDPLVGLGVRHFAKGKLLEEVKEDPDGLTYIMEVYDMRLSPIAEVSSRVYVKRGESAAFHGRTIGGIVAKVNSNGTLGVLLDNNEFIAQLPQSSVYLCEARNKFTLTPEYAEMMDWVRDAGVRRHADADRICGTLYQRGWRVERLYMLQGEDIHCMTYLKKSVRMVVLEKAIFQRTHHAEMRTLQRERIKERDWRYFIQKFSGFVSANFAALGVLSVFIWNYRNYRKHQRSFQVVHAVDTLVHSPPPPVTEEEVFLYNWRLGDEEVEELMLESMPSKEEIEAYRKAKEETQRSELHAKNRGHSHNANNRNNTNKNTNGATTATGGAASATAVNHRSKENGPNASNNNNNNSSDTNNSSTGGIRIDKDTHKACQEVAIAEESRQIQYQYFVENFVHREEEDRWIRQVLRQLNTNHPRVTVLTGVHGCGKSSLLRTAVRNEKKQALFVEVRGKDDVLACVLRSLKVPNVDACGDYSDFIAEVFTKSKAKTGETPILVLSLREGSGLERVYNEVVSLACDRLLCHLILEVALEAIDINHLSLPRMEFYNVPNFTLPQAMAYTQHMLDPLSVTHFFDVMGTNCDDIDELFAAVYHRKEEVGDYIDHRLAKAMRQMQQLWADHPEVHEALRILAENSYEEGLHAGAYVPVLQSTALKDVVIYDPVQHRWLFTRKVYHTATRCCL